MRICVPISFFLPASRYLSKGRTKMCPSLPSGWFWGNLIHGLCTLITLPSCVGSPQFFLIEHSRHISQDTICLINLWICLVNMSCEVYGICLVNMSCKNEYVLCFQVLTDDVRSAPKEAEISVLKRTTLVGPREFKYKCRACIWFITPIPLVNTSINICNR